jgi:hypothetical protein
MSERTSGGTQVSFVELDYLTTLIVIDHDARTQHAWSLVDGNWVEADVVEALHKGRVVHGMTMEGLPPLPTGQDCR